MQYGKYGQLQTHIIISLEKLPAVRLSCLTLLLQLLSYCIFMLRMRSFIIRLIAVIRPSTALLFPRGVKTIQVNWPLIPTSRLWNTNQMQILQKRENQLWTQVINTEFSLLALQIQTVGVIYGMQIVEGLKAECIL